MESSQAGRRGFEPRLPLHLFNKLPLFRLSPEALNGVQPSLRSCKLLILNRPVVKNASLPRWHSQNGVNLLNLQT